MEPPALDARSVGKRYGSTVALAGVDLRVGPGELVGLLGPNGAGKSTLVKVACGLVRADAGTVAVAGEAAGSAAARRCVGYLAELFRFPAWQTADEVLRLHQRLAGAPGDARVRAELLDRVGLAADAGRRVGTMSKGMQQRLGLAQALVGDPRLVLLDEPTSALDPLGRATVREIVGELRAGGAGVLVNSHQLTEVERTCDRVAIMRDGRIVLDAAVDDLLRPTGVTVTTTRSTLSYPDSDPAEVPAIVRALVEDGAEILDVTVDAPTLEDVYAGAMREDRAAR